MAQGKDSVPMEYHLDSCAHGLLSAFQHVKSPRASLQPVMGHEEIRKAVAELCGLGGISPFTRDVFAWPGTVQFNKENSEVSISYSSIDSSPNITEDTQDRLICVAERFITAVHVVQNAELCCDTLTLLRHTHHSAEESGGSPTVQLTRLSSKRLS